jgi:hypothetical protein
LMIGAERSRILFSAPIWPSISSLGASHEIDGVRKEKERLTAAKERLGFPLPFQ